MFPPPSVSGLSILGLRMLLCATLMLTARSAPSPDGEIEALLRYVGELKTEAFIRNGIAYSAKEAEAHLRLKWDRSKGQITSAEDFIRYCATKSSLSGKNYLIRYPSGNEEPAAAVLMSELQRMRVRSATTR